MDTSRMRKRRHAVTLVTAGWQLGHWSPGRSGICAGDLGGNASPGKPLQRLRCIKDFLLPVRVENFPPKVQRFVLSLATGILRLKVPHSLLRLLSLTAGLSEAHNLQRRTHHPISQFLLLTM